MLRLVLQTMNELAAVELPSSIPKLSCIAIIIVPN